MRGAIRQGAKAGRSPKARLGVTGGPRSPRRPGRGRTPGREGSVLRPAAMLAAGRRITELQGRWLRRRRVGAIRAAARVAEARRGGRRVPFDGLDLRGRKAGLVVRRETDRGAPLREPRRRRVEPTVGERPLEHLAG